MADPYSLLLRISSETFKANIDNFVETDPFGVLLLPPKLLGILGAELALLLWLADSLPPGITSSGLFLLSRWFSCGDGHVSTGVARLGLGGCCFSTDKGGMAKFSDISGAAALLTGLWFGEVGIASVDLGTLTPGYDQTAAWTGCLTISAGDAMRSEAPVVVLQ